MRARQELKVVWKEKEKSIVPSPILPFQAKASVTGMPFLLLPLRATPHTPERGNQCSESMKSWWESTRDPKQIVTKEREGSGPGSPFSPHFFGWNKKRETERQIDTEVARKGWPASQKLSPWSKAQAEEVVVASRAPSPTPGVR